jgi:hypothetical protein
MVDAFVNKLQCFITANSYINLYSREFSKDNQGQERLSILHSKLEATYGNALFDIDIKEFRPCEGEEEDAVVALKIINKTLEINGIDPIRSAISVTEALKKLSQKVEDRCILVVFHFFSDIYEEKEKDILRSIRKFIEIFEKSFSLSILIISHSPTYNWELYPEASLDDHHVVLIEYQSNQES